MAVRLFLLLLLAGALRAARCCPGAPDPGTGLDPGPAPPTPLCPLCPSVRPAVPVAESVCPVTRPAVPIVPVPVCPSSSVPLSLCILVCPSVPIGVSALRCPHGRFGRGMQGGTHTRLSPRSWDPPAAPFWTMATPQRFGRRR
ncbi:pro-FMRFamide-related neuropeptide FF [Balearica regulorum gibbericeps]|uniref:pro-FMRFamide-related neuropeptide FF n=1 Tax=Balearica regulorum gibbericeps TaxID=100784 RepID=UPI003F616812